MYFLSVVTTQPEGSPPKWETYILSSTVLNIKRILLLVLDQYVMAITLSDIRQSVYSFK